jgi:hypothetical protein
MHAHLPPVHVPDAQSVLPVQVPPTAARHADWRPPVSPAQHGVVVGICPTPVHAQTPPLHAEPAQHVPFAQPAPSGLHAPATHTPPLHAPLQQLAFS